MGVCVVFVCGWECGLYCVYVDVFFGFDSYAFRRVDDG